MLLVGCGSTARVDDEGGVLPSGPSSPHLTPTAAAAASSRGWDERFVYIGVTTQKDAQEAASSVGAEGLDTGDQEAQATAVADELNRRGGVLGRTVKLVFRDQRTVDMVHDADAVGSAACAHFTQDRPVVAVINPVTMLDRPSFRSCLAKAKVPLVSASVAAVDARVGAELAPYFVQSVAPPWDALAPALVSRLQAQGWFGGWNPRTGTPSAAPARVGVLVVSDPIGRRVGAVITQALTASGARSTITFDYAKARDMSPAVLHFAGNGVTHVIASNADLFSFQLAASSQGYRPRYGITSVNAPQTFLETESPAGQNDGAMGVGWSPSLDVNDAHDPGDTGPGETECKRILAMGGQTFGGKRLAEAVALAFCDGLRLVAAGATAGGGFTGAQVDLGMQRVAGSFRTAFGFRTGLGRDRRFVPGGIRDLIWDSDCRCFRYPSRTTYPI